MTTRNITKKILAGGITLLAIVAPVLAIKVSLDPLYMDARFTPADTLHAGCINSANVMFQSEGQQIADVHMIFSYIPQDIQIAGITSTADKSIINYNIDYDSFVLNYVNSKAKTLNNVTLFQVSFKSSESLTSTVLALDTGSYVLLKDGSKVNLDGKTMLSFAKVAECDPDQVSPTIALVSPQDNKQLIPLDKYFVFDIKDTGKGVDKQSIKIDFDGKHYTSADVQYLQRNGDYLIFYPKSWLPIATGLTLDITVSDLQSYGGANQIKKSFSFETATGMSLMNTITPEMYRKIVGKSVIILGSAAECKMLEQMYGEIDSTSQKLLDGVFSKLACDVSGLSVFAQQGAVDKVHAANLTSQQNDTKVSVFTILGWVLFSIALMLKLYYYFAYRKHKRIAEQLQTAVDNQ